MINLATKRSRTSSPAIVGLDLARVDTLLLDIAQSQLDLTRGQRELAQSTDGKLRELARGQLDLVNAQADLAYALVGQAAGLADLVGRIIIVCREIDSGFPKSKSVPRPDRRVPSPTVDTKVLEQRDGRGLYCPIGSLHKWRIWKPRTCLTAKH